MEFLLSQKRFIVLDAFRRLLGFVPEGDSSFCEIVRGKLNCYTISWEYANVVFAHFPREMSSYCMIRWVVRVINFHFKCCARQTIYDDSFNLNCVVTH